MDVEVENPPDTLRRSDVATVNVLFYLVSTVFQSCTVWSFMNIFETIFDSAKGRDAFDISMAMILWIWNTYVLRFDVMSTFDAWKPAIKRFLIVNLGLVCLSRLNSNPVMKSATF